MPTPSSNTVHWVRTPGYIKGQFNEPVCGIADKLAGYTSVNEERYKSAVNCEHCLYWLWDQEQPARKMDVDQRVVNMTFIDPAANIDAKIEDAVQRGIKAGLEKVKDDFFESEAVANMLRHLVKTSVRQVLTEPATRNTLKNLAEGGVTNALQRADVRQNLIGIHKIAEDELDDEFDDDARDEELHTLMKQAVREVLDEAAPNQTGAGVGTQVYNVGVLTSQDIYHASREALQDHEEAESTVEGWQEEEKARTQQAVAALIASDQFQALFKKLVKEAVEEKKREDERREWDWHMMWYDTIYKSPVLTPRLHNGHKIGTELRYTGDVVEDVKPPVHFRRRYRSSAACGYEGGEDTTVKKDVTCNDCRSLLIP